MPALGRPVKARRWQWIVPLALLCAVGILQELAARHPNLTEEYYGQRMYPHLARALTLISAKVAFSIAEVALVSFLLCLGAAMAARLPYLYRYPQRRWRLLSRALRGALWIVAVGSFLFMTLWGFNYQRPSLAETWGLQTRAPSTNELTRISSWIVSETNRNYSLSHLRDDSGAIDPEIDPAGERRDAQNQRGTRDLLSLCESLKASIQSSVRLGQVRLGTVGVPKPLYFSRLMSFLGISGIYSPFTAEVNFNAEQPLSSLPASIAHESAHLLGFAREDEASFVAFLVAIQAADPFVRYSGYLAALEVVSALEHAEPERFREIMDQLDEGPRRDLASQTAFWARYSGAVSQTAERINHVYLKSNRIRSGVRSYSEVVSLIIGYCLTHGCPPRETAG